MNKHLKHICLIIFSLICYFNVPAQDTTVFEAEPADAVEIAPDTIGIDERITFRSADEDGDFDEIFSIQKVNARKIPEADLDAVKKDDAYWYVNQVPLREKKKTKKPGTSIFDTGWFEVLFWVLLIGGFLALLIWFLATSNIRLFTRKSKAVVEEQKEEELSENIFDINFDKEIQKAIDVRNYRMAVRLMYLQTLKQLSLRNLIAYTPGKTNSDYLFQLSGTSYYKNFFRVTRDFDYVWYGHFSLSDDNFSLIRNNFNTFKSQIV